MNEAHCWELDRLRHRLQAEEFGHQNFPLIQAVEAAIAALHGSEAGPHRTLAEQEILFCMTCNVRISDMQVLGVHQMQSHDIYSLGKAEAGPQEAQESQLTPTTMCPDGSLHVLRCIRCEIPAAGSEAGVSARVLEQLLEAGDHAAMEWRLHGQLTDSCRRLEAALKSVRAALGVSPAAQKD